MAGKSLQFLDESVDPIAVKRMVEAYLPDGKELPLGALLMLHSSKINSHRRHVMVYSENKNVFLDEWLRLQIDVLSRFKEQPAKELAEGLQRVLDYLAHLKMESAEWDAFYYVLKAEADKGNDLKQKVVDLEAEISQFKSKTALLEAVGKESRANELNSLKSPSFEEKKAERTGFSYAGSKSEMILSHWGNSPFFPDSEHFLKQIFEDDPTQFISAKRLLNWCPRGTDKIAGNQILKFLISAGLVVKAKPYGTTKRWKVKEFAEDERDD